MTSVLRSPFGASLQNAQNLASPRFVYALPSNSFLRQLNHIAVGYRPNNAGVFLPDEIGTMIATLRLVRYSGEPPASGAYDVASPVWGQLLEGETDGLWQVPYTGLKLDVSDLPRLDARSSYAFVLDEFEYWSNAGARTVLTVIARVGWTVWGREDASADPFRPADVSPFRLR